MSSHELYVSVDIEASGPVPGRFSMLSIGAVVVGNEKETFYSELQPISAEVVKEAIEVSGLSIDRLRREGEPPKDAMPRFAAWAEAVADGASIVFVGFNAAFDWSFVNWYFHEFVGRNPFGFAPLDIKAFYMGRTRCQWDQTRMGQLPRKLKPEGELTHNALDDARYQAEVFRRVQNSR